MENLEVLTIRRHSYAGKVRPQGERYFVDNEKHLKFLMAIKKVVPVSPKEEKTAPESTKKQLSARKNDRNSSRKGRYNRKDVSNAPQNKKKNIKRASAKNENSKND